MAGYGVGNPAVSAIPHDARPQQVSTPKVPKQVARAQVPPVDPFAPMSPSQIQATIAKFQSGYGTPQTPEQIQSSAQGMLDPIVAAITSNVGKQTAQASQNISGNAASLAKTLGGVDYGAPYAGAEGKQAAVDASLQQSLAGGGQQLAQGLEQRLAQIGGGSVQAASQGLAARGAAIGTNQQAIGSGALSQLIADEAAAGSYGQKMPGIAQMRGLQDIANIQQAGAKQVGDQTTSVMGQLPGIVQGLRNQAQSLQAQKAAAGESLYGTLTGQNITKATASAGLQAGANKLAAAQTANQARTTVAQQNANTAAARARTYETTAQQNATTAASRAKTAATSAAATAAKAAKGPQLTAAQTQKYKGLALTIAQQAFNGAPAVTTKHSNGQVTTSPALPKLTYQQALLEMEKEGVPTNIAVATANRTYGKPLTGPQQRKQNAAVSAGVGVPQTGGPFAGLTGR